MRTIGHRSLSSFLATFFNVGWYVAAIGLVLLVLLALVPLVWTPADTRNVTIAIPASFRFSDLGTLVASPSIGSTVVPVRIEKAHGIVMVRPLNGTAVTVAAILPILGFALLLWVFGLLRDVFRTLGEGQPFVPANATRIRRVGYAVLLGELLRSLVVFVANYLVMAHVTSDAVRFYAVPSLEVYTVVSGLVILVIAEVFRAGTRLDEEQSLTV